MDRYFSMISPFCVSSWKWKNRVFQENSIFSIFVNALGNSANCSIFVRVETIETYTTEPTANKIKAGNEIKTRVKKSYKSEGRKVELCIATIRFFRMFRFSGDPKNLRSLTF